METVTMVNSKGDRVYDVTINFIDKWIDLGFRVESYNSDKVVMFKDRKYGIPA